MGLLTVKRRRVMNLAYAVDPDEIPSDRPAGTELDLWREKAVVSLVGYDVVGVEKWGIPIPVSYPVLELRLHLTKNGHSGYTIIKKFVPKYSIAWLVNLIYGEDCEKRPMQRDHTEEEQQYRYLIQIELDIHREKVRMTGRKPSREPRDNSAETWLLNRDRAFTPGGGSYTLSHSTPELYHVEAVENTIAFEAFFGEQWAFLVEMAPTAQFFADGMDVDIGWPG